MNAPAPNDRTKSLPLSLRWWWVSTVCAFWIYGYGWLMPVSGAALMLAFWAIFFKLPKLAFVSTQGTRPRRLGIIALYVAVSIGVHQWASHLDRQIDPIRDQVSQAVLSYKSDHGHYPINLETLVPRYLPSVPKPELGEWPAPFVYFVAKEEPSLYQLYIMDVAYRFDFQQSKWRSAD